MSQPEEVEDDLLCKVFGLGQVVAITFWSGRSERTFWDSQRVEALAFVFCWVKPPLWLIQILNIIKRVADYTESSIHMEVIHKLYR